MNKPYIASNLIHIQEEIDTCCTQCGRTNNSIALIVVTKTHPLETVQDVLEAGNKDVGENRVQEILQKAPLLQNNGIFHLIGHLQYNKVSKVVPWVDWIQSVDTEKILRKIDAECLKLDKTMKILIQVNTTAETTKSGCLPEETRSLCEMASQCRNLDFRGLMTIGPLEGDEKEVRGAFSKLRLLGDQCGDLITAPQLELSMGMSNDYLWAIEEGATMIRIGSRILGQRSY